MRDDEKTKYVNGATEDAKESTVYIGENQPEIIAGLPNGTEESMVYIGKTDTEGTTSKVITENQTNIGGNEPDVGVVEEKKGQNEATTDCSASDNKVASEDALYYLPTNTMLQKRYRINSVLGEGGFGITYSGWDVTLNIPVAIKEYYPSGLVTRNATLGKTTQVVPVASVKYGTQFRDGIDRVLDEARRMAKFRNTPGIVGIYDFFEANNTAYIVMEYIEGVTLDTYCKNNRMDNTTLFNMLVPVMDALQALHNEGIIHRDISPDNIMVDTDGNFKLLDFGAARGYSEESSTTMSVIVKKSYAPEEQFRTKGKQGPWTDVYALGATIYELITGQTPPTSIDRLAEDDIVDIKDCAPALTKSQADAIMTALAVRQNNRWQTMEEFKMALLYSSGSADVKREQTQDIIKNKTEENAKKVFANSIDIKALFSWIKNNKIISGAIIAVVLVIVGLFTFLSNNDEGPGYLGIYLSNVPQEIKDEYSVGDGVYITGVIANTPASKSGFVAGDIITAIDNNELFGEKDFSNIITRYYSGEKVKVNFLHISKEGQYVEKSKTVKLANKNKQDEAALTVSSITTDTSNNSIESDLKDLSVEFVGAEKSYSSSSFLQVYLKFNNPNDKNINASIKNISLNGSVVSTFDNAEGLIANQDTVLKFQVDYSEIIADQIGDIINTVHIQYYYDDEYNNIRECTDNNFEYSISSKTFITEEKVNDSSDNIDITEANKNDSEEIVEDELQTEAEADVQETENNYASASSDELVVSLSNIEEKSSYTDLCFLVENNSNKKMELTPDWVYLNDTAIKRALDDGLLELEPHTGSVIEYTFHSGNWRAAKGTSVDKLEVGFKINGSDEPVFYDITKTKVTDSVNRLLGFEMDRMKSASKSENIEVTLSEIEEKSSYTDVTFTVKNISSSTIDLGTSWTFIDGSAVMRALSDGSHSLAPGKASVINYTYNSEYVLVGKDENIDLIRLQFFINDANEPEAFYFAP